MDKTTNIPASQTEPAVRQPVHHSRAPVYLVSHRALRAAVWCNQTDNGPFFYTTVSRSYKEGKLWKESSSFGYDDLLIVAELLRSCYGFISCEMARQIDDPGELEPWPVASLRHPGDS